MHKALIVENRGCSLSAVKRGQGEAVLFIQGVGVVGNGWLPQVQQLSERFTCVTFDNRGIGLSQANPDSLTIEQMADDTRAILDACGIDRAHVVGHSMGGLIALALALDNRPRIRSLALLCTFANGRSAAPLTARMCWLGMRTVIGTRRMRRKAFLRLIMSPDALDNVDADALADRLASLFGHDLADQPPIVNRQLRAMRAFDATARLAELAGIPSIVLGARHDPIAPPHLGRAQANGIPGAQFVLWNDASHGAPIQHAERTNGLLQDWWNRSANSS